MFFKYSSEKFSVRIKHCSETKLSLNFKELKPKEISSNSFQISKLINKFFEKLENKNI